MPRMLTMVYITTSGMDVFNDTSHRPCDSSRFNILILAMSLRGTSSTHDTGLLFYHSSELIS
jgi:hypothetical protein